LVVALVVMLMGEVAVVSVVSSVVVLVVVVGSGVSFSPIMVAM
jgi:hypothetical protein